MESSAPSLPSPMASTIRSCQRPRTTSALANTTRVSIRVAWVASLLCLSPTRHGCARWKTALSAPLWKVSARRESTTRALSSSGLPMSVAIRWSSSTTAAWAILRPKASCSASRATWWICWKVLPRATSTSMRLRPTREVWCA